MLGKGYFYQGVGFMIPPIPDYLVFGQFQILHVQYIHDPAAHQQRCQCDGGCDQDDAVFSEGRAGRLLALDGLYHKAILNAVKQIQ